MTTMPNRSLSVSQGAKARDAPAPPILSSQLGDRLDSRGTYRMFTSTKLAMLAAHRSSAVCCSAYQSTTAGSGWCSSPPKLVKAHCRALSLTGWGSSILSLLNWAIRSSRTTWISDDIDWLFNRRMSDESTRS